MQILLLGNTGQLGWELERSLSPLGEVRAFDLPVINMADVDHFVPYLRQSQAQVIVNATAYTAVDQAEQEAELAQSINAQAPGVLATEARKLGAAFIHYSTDYVFDGSKGSPFLESDPPSPLGVYGQTKLQGEEFIQQAGEAFLILRTSWVYSLRRESFVSKVLKWARQQRSLRLVDDQVSGPTWSRMLAEATALILAKAGNQPYPWIAERRGIYHLAGSGYCSRKEWGEAILQMDPFKQEQVVQEILPAKTTDFPTPAQRPLFSALDCSRFHQVFGFQLPAWRKTLQLAMNVDQQLGGTA